MIAEPYLKGEADDILGGIRVGVDQEVLVLLQQGSGNHRGGLVGVKGLIQGVGLNGVRNAGNDLLALHDLVGGHRNGLLRHVVEGGEPALAHLLAAASVVEIDDDVGFTGVEVGGRVVEGDVTVFTDADEADVDRLLLHHPRHRGEPV